MRVPRGWCALLALALACGCGYRISGLGAGQLPGGVTRVVVPVFENRTSRTELSNLLTGDFVRELASRGKVRVEDRADAAEAVVRGTVVSYKTEPVSFDAAQKPLEYRMTVSVDVELVRVGGKQPLFAERGVTVQKDYPAHSDLQENAKEEQSAGLELAHDMSRKLVTLMAEGF